MTWVLLFPCGRTPRTLLVMNDDDSLAAAAAVKQTAILLRDAQAAPWKLDTLATQASALNDPSLPHIAEARTAITWLVSEDGHKEQAEQRRSGCTPPTSLTHCIVL